MLVLKGGVIIKSSNIYNKHLNLSKRIQIEQYLNEGKTISEISELINKSRNTIYYEIKKHRQLVKCNRYGVSPKFDMICPKTNKTPFVCNSCPSRKSCRKNRFYYVAENANNEYKYNLSTSRQGINMDALEFQKLNQIVKDGINKCLSFSMILHINKDINICKRTLYRYQEKEYLDILNIDLPRLDIRKEQKDNKLFLRILNTELVELIKIF